MTMNFSPLIKRKSVIITLVLCITVCFVLVYLYKGQQEKSIHSLLKTMFQSPNPDVLEIMNESTENYVPNGETILDASNDYMDELGDIYGKYFTQSAYDNFVRMAMPTSQYSLICDEKGYTIKIEDLQIIKDTTSSREGYTFNAKLKLSNNGSETSVAENGYIAFSEDSPDKIDYFWVSDALLNKLYTI